MADAPSLLGNRSMEIQDNVEMTRLINCEVKREGTCDDEGRCKGEDRRKMKLGEDVVLAIDGQMRMINIEEIATTKKTGNCFTVQYNRPTTQKV